MPVVSAGVHGSGNLRPMVPTRRLLDGQAVHVGPQRDRAGARAARERGHEPGAADAGLHLPAELGADAGEELGGLGDLESDSGNPVQFVSPGSREHGGVCGDVRGEVREVRGGVRCGVVFGTSGGLWCHTPMLAESGQGFQRRWTKFDVSAGFDATLLRVRPQ